MAAEPIIRVRNLTTHYSGQLALEDISFEVRRGEICVVLGASGSGKSTLFRHILRLLDPTSGTIEVDGRDITRAAGAELLDARRKMGVLFQSGALFSSMTLAENVALPLTEYTPLAGELLATVIRFKLALVDLAGFEDFMPAELSGGMRKRAGLARAMALDPEILLFDEMSAGLDPVSAASLDELVLRLNRSLGITILVITHELPSIQAIAGHAIMLEKGRLIADGTPAELAASELPAVRAFFRREAADDGRAQRGGGWSEIFGGAAGGGRI